MSDFREYTSAAEMVEAYKARVRRARPYQQVTRVEREIFVKWPETICTEWIFQNGKGWRLVVPSASDIIKLVAKVHGVTVGEMKGPRRFAHLIAARHHAMVALYDLKPDLSLPAIGRFMGGKDHTTVLHAVNTWPKRKHLYARQVAEVEAACG